MPLRSLCLAALLLTLVGGEALCERPSICIVVDPQAPKLEQFAGQELSAILSKVSGGKAQNSATVLAEAEVVVLLGSPATNAAVKQALGDTWPKLSDQGHLLKSAKLDGRNVLVVGGGSPVATLWAAYELGHQLGVRYLMQSDVYPPEPVPLKLEGFNLVLEPVVETRSCSLLGDSPLGTSTWSLADHERLVGQLAKLKFNRAIVGVVNVQRFPVDGDTAGRAAFKGASEFGNPDLAAFKTPEELASGRARLSQAVAAKARELGMTVKTSEQLSAEQDRQPGVLPSIHLQSNLPLPANDNGQVLALTQGPSGDLNPEALVRARTAFKDASTAEAAYHELFDAVCGKREVSERLIRGFDCMAQATAVLAKKDPEFTAPKADLMLRHFRVKEASPAWFKQVKELYTQSMIEMFRSHDNCRPSSRKYLYYHCKRGEFAVEYLNAVEAVRLAGEARRNGDSEKCLEQLEKGVESLYNGINALSEVARDQSDRALIAELNEYAYRPLVKQLETELDSAE